MDCSGCTRFGFTPPWTILEVQFQNLRAILNNHWDPPKPTSRTKKRPNHGDLVEWNSINVDLIWAAPWYCTISGKVCRLVCTNTNKYAIPITAMSLAAKLFLIKKRVILCDYILKKRPKVRERVGEAILQMNSDFLGEKKVCCIWWHYRSQTVSRDKIFDKFR